MRLTFTVGALLFAAGWLYGQNASLTGFVKDASGAAIAKAAVEARSDSTGQSLSTVSNDTGLYFFGSLKPGNYTVTAQAPGFQTSVRPGLKLDVLQNANLDFTLTVGLTKESVTVTGAPDLMQTNDASVSTVIGHQFVDNMPMNGRSFNTLVALSPGTVEVPTNESSRGMYAINGQRSDANMYYIDGVGANVGVSSSKGIGGGGAGSNVGMSSLGTTNNMVSIDALQEFRILTSTYAPEYGRTAGGQISIVTRSGTNQFHGAVFEYLRNNVLDANDWFANRAGTGQIASRQNDFGGVLGGPIKKDRTFFFLSYEGLRLRQPNFAITDVPSMALRQQAPSYLQPFMNAYPKPTGPDEIDAKTGKLNGLAPASAAITNPSTMNAASLKIDHMVNSKLQLFGRYDYAPSHSDVRAGSISSALDSFTRFDDWLQTATVGAVQILSPTMTNDIRANYSRSEGERHFFTDTFGGGAPPPDSLWFPSGYTSDNALLALNITAGLKMGIANGALSNVVNQQYNVMEALSIVKGAHQLKFGLEYFHYNTAGKNNAFQSSASYSGTGFLGVTPGTLLSGLGNTTVSISRPGDLLFNSWGLYAQDTWKANARLTLTSGLRWELDPPPGAGNGLQPYAVDQISNPAAMVVQAAGTRLYQTQFRNFAPRLGVAYQLSRNPNWGAVIRGGAGLFYDTGFGALSTLMAWQPFVATGTLANIPIPLYPLPSEPQFVSAPPYSGFQGVDPHLKLPHTGQWNVSLEQSLGGRQSVTVSYVGAAGRDLYVSDLYLGLSPAYLAITTLGSNDSYSNYNSLQVQLNHQFSHGLQALVNYAWSHSIDTASNSSAMIIHPPNYIPNQNLGNSDFDMRQNFSLAAVYQVPTPRFAGSFGRAVLGGWGIDPLVRLYSALPVDVNYTRAISGSNITGRVNYDGLPPYLYDSTAPGGKRLNPAAFSGPSTYTQGNLGRNALRGFPLSQFDLSAVRYFRMTERLRLQFRSDFFNVLNHPNFGAPNAAYSTSSTFGYSTAMTNNTLNASSGGGFNALYQIGGPRSIQLSLRLNF